MEHGAKRHDTHTVSKSQKTITYTKAFWLFLVGRVAGVLIEGLFCLIVKGHWETHVVPVLAPYSILYGLGIVLFYVGAVKLQHRSLVLQIIVEWKFLD